MSKEKVVETIKQWIVLNNEIKTYQKTIKDLRTKKQELTIELIKIMETNNIDCFDVANGKILCKKSKCKAPLNKELLSKMLKDYFEEDDTIDVGDITEYLNTNRPIKEKSVIVMKN
tara:strand:- start:182 stop:529 length:348 start_codon:yes stop_codon:yes gene_type:complete